jgi:hypothetical protein
LAHIPDAQAAGVGVGQAPAPSHVWAGVRTPSAQDWPGPHAVPAGWFPLVVHTGLPVVHAISPFVHAFPVSQLMPVVHDPHVPLWHTLFVPQLVPLSTFPVSVHTGEPVAQAIAPVLQAVDGWQVIPTVHDTHVPLPQTLFVPHVVPLVTLPVTVQTGKPLPQAIAAI